MLNHASEFHSLRMTNPLSNKWAHENKCGQIKYKTENKFDKVENDKTHTRTHNLMKLLQLVL